jgi:hypothetical protein
VLLEAPVPCSLSSNAIKADFQYLPALDYEEIAKLVNELVSGVNVRFTGRRVSTHCPNLPTALERPDVIDKSLLADLDSGKIVGPFDFPP